MAFPHSTPPPQIRAANWPLLEMRQAKPDPHSGYPVIEIRKRVEVGAAHPLTAALAEIRTPLVLAIVRWAIASREGSPLAGEVAIRRHGGTVMVRQASKPEHATLRDGDVVELLITGEGVLIG